MRLTRKSKLILAGIATIAITGGSAIAYWTTGGTGTGSATVGTSTAVAVTQVGVITALIPGAGSQPIDFKINNPRATAQYVTAVAISISVPAGGDALKPDCTTADFALVQPAAINSDLAFGDTTFAPSGASLALKNTGFNQDNCKNATVTITFTAS